MKHDSKSFRKKAATGGSNRYIPREEPAPYKQWGEDLEMQSVEQMRHACSLPVSVAGALMPDAHLGYGLPIGGVLATDNAGHPLRCRGRYCMPYENDRLGYAGKLLRD